MARSANNAYRAFSFDIQSYIIEHMKNENLEHKRHTLAHLMARAVINHYPDAKPTIGPAIDNGFYYDFEFSKPISDADLVKIEATMRELLPTWTEFSHEEVTADQAREKFAHNEYKTELINELEEKGETITLYTAGDFTDLCRGGHSENPSKEIASDSFTISHLAGAYWRGLESNKMLTRIYGLAFDTKAELDAYITMQEEAKKRDHRKLGKELDLFTFSDLVGPGLPLWTPKGTLLTDLIMNKIETIQTRYGYQKVRIPHITKSELYKTSGHWEKFGDELFKVTGKAGAEFVLKPMNCPHHTQIYASSPRSYKDLPIRYMELGVVYRDEQAGELMGLSRVRSITMDDGHLFCRPDQIEEEIKNIVSVIREFYNSLGMLGEGNYWVSLSARDPKTKEKYLGGDEIWDIAESALEKIAQEEKLNYKKIEGEAAFYGPKLDFMFKDALGRERQLATAQLDFNMPNRFGLEYTDKDGSKKTPVMIHRAIAGSMERFLSVMIEHFAGAFPYWLSPVQVKILPIAEAHHEYARGIEKQLLSQGVRVELDDGNETLGKKIRNWTLEKVPYAFVVGDKEIAENKVGVESRDDGKLGAMSVEEFLKQMEVKELRAKS
ncbi:threonine--tRNA ligase [Candidatus Campbellbacteria bacterium CG22_combo_CG10-13_8_21_14_all_36_13]|uniref:Threonine--tRNA ligase n=1 Tax=Candidatus Campbellbacteria bacterium CG22_combo_CG10-13_8_21_14_all_36_13 TaxID=1974529 RepID=A0A2H0DZD6_9BACT|nr:MAG: threonine--tRNA ligase [Candidatus Campbellbacteria bacterium CG22_combo_CG10-13_8_21_14_all_36_13]